MAVFKMEEPQFLYDDFEDKGKKKLQKVLDISNPKNYQTFHNAVILKNLIDRSLHNYANKKYNHKIRKDDLTKRKEYLLSKIKELHNKHNEDLPRIEEIKKTINLGPDPQFNFNIEKHENKPKLEINNIIVSKDSKKILSQSSFNGAYYELKESKLKEEDYNFYEDLKSKIEINSIYNKEYLLKKIKDIGSKYNKEITPNFYEVLRYNLIKDLIKYYEISPLLEDKNIQVIKCDGPDKEITITYKGIHDVNTNIKLEKDSINNIIKKFAEKSKQDVTQENPFLNTEIEGIKIQATLENEAIQPRFVISKL